MTERSDLMAQALYAAAHILAEHPDGLRSRELWTEITKANPDLEARWLTAVPNQLAYDRFQWHSTGLVKAGWVRKADGRWFLTPVGRSRVGESTDPTTLRRQLDAIYRDWSRNRSRYEQARRLVEGVPAGKWVFVGDLSAPTGIDGMRLIEWLQGERPEGWHRVLDVEGRLPGHLALNERERDDWLELLNDDALTMRAGYADPEARLPLDELRAAIVEDDQEAAEQIRRRAWLIRGSNVQGANLVRDVWLAQQICSLPASRLQELDPGATTAEVRTAVSENYAHASAHERARLAAEYHTFLSLMRAGDVVLTNDGSDVYVGVVNGDPQFVASVERRANLQRPVDWRNSSRPLSFATDLPDEISARLSNPDADVIELTEFLADLERLLGDEPEEPVVARELRLPDASDELADRLLVGREWLQDCVELLRDKPQLIFYGPPGTGKTYLAQQLADHLTGGKPENVQLVQFHPAYSYEDFFEGYRPRGADGGAIAFELVRGPLRRLADAARAHSDEPHVLIIDEINRGNLAKVFGELYFLLEYRGRAVHLLYGSDEGKGFTLPRNLLVIGTMNTADRSIALVDAAMRRRFSFQELHPDEPPIRELLSRWLGRNGQPDLAARLLAELNSRIEDHDFKIGPSYLMRDTGLDDGVLNRIWRTQILPLLIEHHYGDGVDVPKRYGLDVVRGQVATEGTVGESSVT